MTILVDSDILIEVSRGRDPRIVAKWRELGASNVHILYSPVSAAELWAGARANERESLRTLFDALSCVPADYGIGRRSGDYLQRYSKSHSVELADALIAASAVEMGATLWTRNRKHYPMTEIRFFE